MTNHLWQSTWFALAAGLLALLLRKNRASVRYWVWFSASVKFFVPLSLLIGLGSYLQRTPAVVAAPVVSRAIVQAAEPFPDVVSYAPAVAQTRDWAGTVIIVIWAYGFSCIALMRLRGWLRIRAAVRASVASQITASVEVRSAPGLLEPGVFGLVRPVLLLPAGIENYLSSSQLDAVLAHEVSHVRRRDNLTSALHMLVEEGVFWFHPFVWWIGSRMVEERELACDEEVVRLGGEPAVYAEAILNVCKLYVESPLVCVAGVTGADLKKRVEAIMNGCVAVRLSAAKKVVLAGAALVALVMPVFIGKLRAQTAVPKFEVASIRLCNGGESGARGGGGGRGGDAGGGSQGPSPDRLTMNCQPLKNLIRTAYFVFADGHRAFPTMGPPIEGGPGWVDSERYQINAKAEGTPGQDMMRGPMLQKLLEERFQLKIRRVTKEVPVYDLTVAKSGPKLQPFQEGSCAVLDFSRPPAMGPGGKLPPICGFRMVRAQAPNGSTPWEVHGATLDDLARSLGEDLDRIVINKTGIAGKFDFHMDFSPDETTAGLNSLRTADGPLVTASTASDPTGPSIFTAIQQQLGLKLEAAKGPRGFLVIDHVERPSEN